MHEASIRAARLTAIDPGPPQRTGAHAAACLDRLRDATVAIAAMQFATPPGGLPGVPSSGGAGQLGSLVVVVLVNPAQPFPARCDPLVCLAHPHECGGLAPCVICRVIPVASALLLGHRLVQAPQSVVMIFAVLGP